MTSSSRTFKIESPHSEYGSVLFLFVYFVFGFSLVCLFLVNLRRKKAFTSVCKIVSKCRLRLFSLAPPSVPTFTPNLRWLVAQFERALTGQTAVVLLTHFMSFRTN